MTDNANAEKIRRHVGVEAGAELPAHAWPGGYPLSYITADGDELCSDCATTDLDDPDADDPPIGVMAYGADTDYPEDAPAECANCNHVICEPLG